MRTWRCGALGLLSVAIGGCQEPTQIVPTAPPGTEAVRPLPASEGEGSQALGEHAASAAANPTAIPNVGPTLDPLPPPKDAKAPVPSEPPKP